MEISTVSIYMILATKNDGKVKSKMKNFLELKVFKIQLST